MFGIKQSSANYASCYIERHAVGATQRVARIKPRVEQSDTLGNGRATNLRPERAREAWEIFGRATLNSNQLTNGCLSRPFKADDFDASFSQGIAHLRSALGWVLLAFQAMAFAAQRAARIQPKAERSDALGYGHPKHFAP